MVLESVESLYVDNYFFDMKIVWIGTQTSKPTSYWIIINMRIQITLMEAEKWWKPLFFHLFQIPFTRHIWYTQNW